MAAKKKPAAQVITAKRGKVPGIIKIPKGKKGGAKGQGGGAGGGGG